MPSRLFSSRRSFLAWTGLGGILLAVGCASIASKSEPSGGKTDQSTLNNPPKGVRCRIAMTTPVMNSGNGRPQETERWIEATITEVTPEAITVTKGVQRVRRDGGTATKGDAAKGNGEWDEMPLDKAVLPRKSIKSIEVI